MNEQMNLQTYTIYRAYDSSESLGPGGDGSGGQEVFLGYFFNEADAEQIAKGKGPVIGERIDGRVNSLQILSCDGGQSGYQQAGSPLIKVHPPFVDGDAEAFHTAQALKKLNSEELKAMANYFHRSPSTRHAAIADVDITGEEEATVIPPKCYFCKRDVDEKDKCSGCNEYVCWSCDTADAEPIPGHDISAHDRRY